MFATFGRNALPYDTAIRFRPDVILRFLPAALPSKYQGLIANKMTAKMKNPLFPAMNFGKRAALQAKVAQLAAPNIKESQHEPCTLL